MSDSLRDSFASRDRGLSRGATLAFFSVTGINSLVIKQSMATRKQAINTQKLPLQTRKIYIFRQFGMVEPIFAKTLHHFR